MNPTVQVFLLCLAYANAFFVGSQRSFLPQSTVLYQTHEEVEDFRKGVRSGDEKGPNDSIDVVMKFGGSSLADASRVDHVANLIKDQIQAGVRPRAVVCSAMGKTTNALLSAGDFALGTKFRCLCVLDT